MGYCLHPFQKEALEALNKNTNPLHVICVAPTGSGKSLIYEKAASLKNRKTLLITPLVALARQQLKTLLTSGIPTTIAAGGENQGPPKSGAGVWILSPESLNLPIRSALLKQWSPDLLVIDECHCLWEWGDTFRPAFQKISKIIEEISFKKTLWLTATLSLEARTHLKKMLSGMILEIGQFNLPAHLSLHVEKLSWNDRMEGVISYIKKANQAGIIFASTRASTERIARCIESIGKKVLVYHAGMSREEREKSEALIFKKIPDVVIATSAFGMGIHYPHLSYVLLWQSPPSLLILVQMIGRVGRNAEKKAQAIAFWDQADFQLLEWTIAGSEKRRKEILDVFRFFSSENCRKNFLRHYFDPNFYLKSPPCGHCDRCFLFQ